MTTYEALGSFSLALEKATKEKRLGDVRLYSHEIQHLSIEKAASQLLLEKLTDLRNFQTEAGNHTHVFLFTGHMIDAPDRKEPRFPATKEAIAFSAIKDHIQEEIDLVTKKHQGNESLSFLGITGGASGGDILFHEACKAHDVPSHMYLLFPRDMFLDASVRSAGQGWIDRFDEIYNSLSKDERPVLGPDDKLPKWLYQKQPYSIWVRNNMWMLHNALVYGGENVTLFALWNGEGGDGVGGTQDMVNQAKANGAKAVIIDTKKIFGL